MRESLVDKEVIRSSQAIDEISVLPNSHVILLGGRSIMDNGRKVIFPLIDEIAENNASHQMILGVSGGIRVRHAFSIAHDFGLPTGGMAMLVGGIEEQNTRMIYALLAKHKGARFCRERFEELPLYLDNGMIPILVASPPYHYWEQPPRVGTLPEHGSDFGMFMVSETLGSKSMIYLKDQDGLYTDDPKKNPDAKLIDRVENVTPDIESLAADTLEHTSIGGMATKLEAAKIACATGVPMVIANGHRTNIVEDVLEGRATMTIFGSETQGLSHRKRWIAFGRTTKGDLRVDNGARDALLNRGTSLLAAGIIAVEGEFDVGEAVDITDARGHKVARGITNYSCTDIQAIMGLKSGDIKKKLGHKDYDEVIHRDNLVIL